MAFDPGFRLALWEAWNARCAWCGQDLTLQDMEIDHLIATGLEGEERRRQLERFGLDPGYDFDSPENLVPAHSRCNRVKSNRPLADAPIIAQLRQEAARKAPWVEEEAEKNGKRRRVTRAVAQIEAADPD